MQDMHNFIAEPGISAVRDKKQNNKTNKTTTLRQLKEKQYQNWIGLNITIRIPLVI